MGEYKRLTKRKNERIYSRCEDCSYHKDNCCTFSEKQYYRFGDLGERDCLYALIERLAELEDKIENGTLIELPCGVGDRVYVLDNDKISDKPKISEASVIDFDITSYNFSVLVRENGYDYHLFNCGLGCDWFLTKAEAEEKLKELKGEV